MAIKPFNLVQHQIMRTAARDLYNLYMEVGDKTLAKQWYKVWQSHNLAIGIMEAKVLPLAEQEIKDGR